jgi:poly-gamma-glutamate capsule biosynthesis protein CapA/YwtB (metallophosphatase superfamily)
VGGVDVANLANNHAGDFGLTALLDGADNVRRAGIAPVGVGADAAAAMEGASFERNGWRIIVLGFNAKAYNPEWFAGPGRPGMASGLVAETIAAAVVAAKERADLVFVTIHWGIEGTFSPHRDDITRAHAAVDAGADAVFGHHPHRLQPLEHYRGSPIFWSLGNFVWQSVARSRNTAVARVVVEPDGTVEGSLLPVVIADKGHPVAVG